MPFSLLFYLEFALVLSTSRVLKVETHPPYVANQNSCPCKQELSQALWVAWRVFAKNKHIKKLVLDPFTFPSSALFIITGNVDGGNNARDAISESNVDPSILGGERDINLRVLFSEADLVLSTNVNGGLFSASTPNGPTGNVFLQLDGIDNSTDINRQGLNNLPESNFLGLGATEFRYTATSDHPTDVVLKVYQRQGGKDYICQRSNTVPGDNVLTTVRVDFNEFLVPSTGGACDISFNKIGAVEISLVMKTAVDINIRNFELWGPVVTCHCFCPTYTCRIELDNDNEYFYYRSSDFNPDNNISNPTTDFSTVNVGTTRSATPTTGLTPTRTPVVDPGTSGSPVTVSNGSPSTVIIISGGNDSSSDASVLALAGALIFLVAALF